MISDRHGWEDAVENLGVLFSHARNLRNKMDTTVTQINFDDAQAAGIKQACESKGFVAVRAAELVLGTVSVKVQNKIESVGLHADLFVNRKAKAKFTKDSFEFLKNIFVNKINGSIDSFLYK